MPLPFLSRKSDKKLFQPREIPQVSRPIPQQQRPRFSEPRSVKYIAADEEEEVQVPDTRVLAALGECASQVAMVETYDAPLLSPSGRRSSNASASSSSVLITPTFPYEPQWRRTDKVVPEVGEEEEAQEPALISKFSHNQWESSVSEELDLSQLLSLTGGSGVQSPFGFASCGSKTPSPTKTKPRPQIADDDEDFYTPRFGRRR